MTSPLTDKESLERLEAIRARVEKATKGPWKGFAHMTFGGSWSDKERPGVSSVDESNQCGIVGPDGKCVLWLGNSEQYYPTEGDEPSRDDFEFIVSSRADVEFLLSLLESSRERGEKLAEGCALLSRDLIHKIYSKEFLRKHNQHEAAGGVILFDHDERCGVCVFLKALKEFRTPARKGAGE